MLSFPDTPLLCQSRNGVHTTFIPRRPHQPPPAPTSNLQPGTAPAPGAPPPGPIPIPLGILPGATAVANMVVDVDEFGNFQMVGTPMVEVIPSWPPQAGPANPQMGGTEGGGELPEDPAGGTGGTGAGGGPAGAASAPQGTNPLPGMFGSAGGLGHVMGVMPAGTHISVGGAPLFGISMGPQGTPGLMGMGQHQQQQHHHQFGLQGGPGMVGMAMSPLDMGALFGNVLQGMGK